MQYVNGTEMAFKEMDDRLEAAMTEIKRLRARVAQLEQENQLLQSSLDNCERSADDDIAELMYPPAD